ncbi:MAG: 4-hydroxyphenylacetate 3-monooxygenase, oxygenase component [Candidatus Binatus sp.]|uniref:4-hydroxyphenylacetate 3-monooxygenase, oxygenase component n=1 Tax=Candidatus Binatus sp. TaxID=2811406 RepID=UPI003C776408
MGARSGNNYLSSLKKLGAEIWIGGARAGDVTAHPAFANCARSIASLYDMQMEHPETMTFRTDDGGRAGMSFIIPKNADDLRKRTRMMKAWADFGCGMLGRTPDYLNVSLAAMAAARSFFSESDARYGENIWNYYVQARHHDWCATHTMANPRAIRGARWTGHTGAEPALKLVEKTSDGIIVNGGGMLATLAPLSEEILVLPSTELQAEPAAEPFALSFAIQCNAKGLKFICRDSCDAGGSRFDNPLASRFDEMDAVAVFDNVLVPWERVFLCGDVARYNALYAGTGAVVHMMHQVVVKNVAKSEFILGLAARIAQDGDEMQLHGVRERLAEMITTTETMRACLRAAEADAAPDQWGVFMPARAPLDTACNLFPRLYPRMVEIIQLSSSSSLMATPSASDFANPAEVADIERYFAAADTPAKERVALYRLAWEVACSAFGGRQVLYERFFFGDPVGIASALVDSTDLKPLADRVRAFLKRPD